MTRRTRTKPTVLPLGTISEGTLRPEDLIPAYLDAIADIRVTRRERCIADGIRLETRFPTFYEPDGDTGSHDNLDHAIERLTEILESHVPDYCYFGTLEGDGACFGVWVSDEVLTPGARVDDLIRSEYSPSQWREMCGRPGQPAEDHGCTYYLQVNDHGNATLYRRAGNRWVEVWSVV